MKKPILIKTSDNCIIDGSIYKKLPILINSQNKIVFSATDYFRHLAINEKLEINYVNNIALLLKRFCYWLELKNLDWNKITGPLMRLWRDETKERVSQKKGYNNNDEKRKCEVSINRQLCQIYNFYYWSQLNGYFDELMGSGIKINKTKYPIPVLFKQGKNTSTVTIKCPILYKTSHKAIIDIPTPEKIDEVYENMVNAREKGKSKYAEELIVRDELIIDWLIMPSLRRKEVASLRVEDLPTRNELKEDIDNNRMCKVLIKHGTKYGKKRQVPVAPEQIQRTYDYINNERIELLKGRTEKKEPPELFISSRHRKLTDDTITSMIKKYGTNPHRLRHYGITKFVELEFEARKADRNNIIDIKGIAVVAMEYAGHSDFNFTMNTYVHPVQRQIENKAGFGNTSHFNAGKEKVLKQKLTQKDKRIEELERENKLLKKNREKK